LRQAASMQKRLLAEYIKAFADVLTPSDCQALIDRFEAARERHEIKRIEDGYSFVQLDVTKAWPDIDARIEQMMNICYNQYRTLLGVEHYWPSSYLHESLRLKRYMPDGRDGFPPHVDVMDQASSARFCTAIIYLNDPGGGGETVFPELGVRIPPEPGKLIMFPPLWVFPHAGLPPHNKPKYILHSYIGYPRA
jgi:prolyl 4-hydroxylase